MDSPSSCLDGSSAPVVADTSVVINLNASRISDTILDVLPNRFLVVDQVLAELETGQRNEHIDFHKLSGLVAQGRVEIVQLGDAENPNYDSLVNDVTSESLGDGEAATIAFAHGRCAVALVDDRKALRIGAERFRDLSLGCSLDLFTQRDVRSELGCEGLKDAIYNALEVGRMRVSSDAARWVVDLIGAERASSCRSLARHLRQFTTLRPEP
ncbi:MAG: hypothetical protein OXC19_25275 [Bryobacterales bacterium]|nr:hypothetical protein [Bryobacterales bacterium]